MGAFERRLGAIIEREGCVATLAVQLTISVAMSADVKYSIRAFPLMTRMRHYVTCLI